MSSGRWIPRNGLLAKALDPERASMIMDDIRGPAGRTMWDKLSNVNEGILANYLKNEYPQTVAVVLSRIRSDHAAKVLEQMPEAFFDGGDYPDASHGVGQEGGPGYGGKDASHGIYVESGAARRGLTRMRAWRKSSTILTG